jgi:hypothetical protein
MTQENFPSNGTMMEELWNLGVLLMGVLFGRMGQMMQVSQMTLVHFANQMDKKSSWRGSEKLAIGNQGYRGEECISVYNSLNNKAVKMFKRCALLRHETFNGLTRTFDI